MPFQYCIVQWVNLGATVVDEGDDVGTATFEESSYKCGERCESTTNCRSFAFCNQARGGSCYLKDKILSNSETLNNPSTCASYKKGMFSWNNGEIGSLVINELYVFQYSFC